jgi:hypothetical protein
VRLRHSAVINFCDGLQEGAASSALPTLQCREQNELRAQQIKRCFAVADDEKFPFTVVEPELAHIFGMNYGSRS